MTTALLDTLANIKVVSEKFFKSLPQTPQLLKVHTHIKSFRAYLGLVGQLDLTFRQGNK